MASDTFHHPDLERIYFDECEALGLLQKLWLQPVITQRKDLHMHANIFQVMSF